MSDVQNSISFLLLPHDRVSAREDDHCIEIATENSGSSDRGKLFEKYLARRYNLLQEHKRAIEEHCNLSMKTTVTQKTDSVSAKVGENNSVKRAEQKSTSTSFMDFLFSQGITGEIEAGPERLKVVCRLIGADKASLQFQFYDKTKGGLSTEIITRRGEWQNIGSIVRELNEKNKTLGIPQTDILNTKVDIETQYDLQIK